MSLINIINRIPIAICIAVILLVTLSADVSAQCSMCKAIAESGANDDTINVAKGLNSGILYLLSIPYLLGGVAFFIWRKNRRKQIVTN